MAPSRLHEELAMALDHVVDVAASSLAGAVKALRTTRLSEPGAPPGTGMEPDGAFYVGDNARAYREALAKGEDAADAFFEKTAPDVVVEVELTDVEAQKIDRYGDLGVQELWLLRRRRDEQIPEAEFLALRPPPKPRCLTASNLVGGLTPADVREAVSGARLSLTRDERTQAIAHVVRRRRHSRVRICEDSAS